MAEHGYKFEVAVPAGVEEIAPAHLSPGETVLANARAKARAALAATPGAIVLGVDTEVFFEGRVLGKPADMDAAFAMLSRLNGRTHEVYSGVWILGQGKERGFIEVLDVLGATPRELVSILEAMAQGGLLEADIRRM